MGRSASTRKGFMGLFGKPSLTEQLITNAPNLDIHIIPDSIVNQKPYNPYKSNRKNNKAKSNKNKLISFTDILKSTIILIIASIIGFIFQNAGFDESNIILCYVVGVLFISIVTVNRYYSIVSSVVAVLVFNFLFTEPYFSLKAYGAAYPVTFVVMFIAALISGSLAEKLKQSARQSALAAYRTKVLFDLNQLMQKADNIHDIVSATALQLNKLLNKNIIVYIGNINKNRTSSNELFPNPNYDDIDGSVKSLSEPLLFPLEGQEIPEECYSYNEKAVAMWTYKNNKQSGATTQTLSNAKCRYLSLKVNDDVYGVVGIVINDEPIDNFENSILISMLGECALALENEKNAREKEESELLAKNEQLRANLLRAISHDLRTPLTSISGNASNLLSNGDSFNEVTKKQLYNDIYDDSMWLINLVENLLAVSKIQEGRLNLNIVEELISDVVDEALKHINRKSVEHNIKVIYEDDLQLAKMDSRLIIQVIINIVDNAIKYTPKGSDIIIETRKIGSNVVVSIKDNGDGIPAENKKHIFDMFFCGANKVADSRRSLGLGLSLCKSIIEAHGGKLTVTDNKPKGTVFVFTLHAGETTIYE